MSPLASSKLLTHLLIFRIHYSSSKAQNVTQGSITELVRTLDSSLVIILLKCQAIRVLGKRNCFVLSVYVTLIT